MALIYEPPYSLERLKGRIDDLIRADEVSIWLDHACPGQAIKPEEILDDDSELEPGAPWDSEALIEARAGVRLALDLGRQSLEVEARTPSRSTSGKLVQARA